VDEMDRRELAALRGIAVAQGGRLVLRNVSLSVSAGEIVTLIGPNGSGKTTAIRTLLGLLKPQQGRIFRAPGMRVGYMPQRLQVDPVLPLTVHRFLRLSAGFSAERLKDVLVDVGAAHLLDASVATLSGGEMQRVLLAKALLRDPQLLVLDEPAQGVDVNGQVELYDAISRIRSARGCGVLLASHDLYLVMSSTDHVVCINQHVCCSGEPQTVARHPAYLELFGATAGRLAPYVHHHDHAHDLHGKVTDGNAFHREPQTNG